MDAATKFRLVNELIVAISQFLWPLVAALAIVLFRRDIKAVLSRLRKGKLFGQEIELDPEARLLRELVLKAEQEIPAEPVTSETKEFKHRDPDSEAARVLDDSASNPEVGIIRLSADLERELKELLGSMGYLAGITAITVPQALAQLDKRGWLPKNTMDSLRAFWDLRNKIVHGGASVDRASIFSVLDTGITLLRTIRAIPHEVNIVSHTGVELFADKACTSRMEGVKGLILESLSPGGTVRTERIFPITRTNYYYRGKRVTWEWNIARVWPSAWYKDPHSDVVKQAWGSAAEFVGRHIDEL